MKKFFAPFLILLLPAMTVFAADRATIEQVSLSAEEAKLYQLINEYRAQNGLAAIPLSKSLSYVAQQHVLDLHNNFTSGGACNLHSWSDKGEWSPVCYTSNHAQAAGMWDKPREMTPYTGNGYEIAFGGSGGYVATADRAMSGWKSSSGHDDVMLNRNSWRSIQWQAVGVGLYKGYSVVWFGEPKDPVVTTDTLSAPSQLTLVNTTTSQFEFSWASVANAESYVVQLLVDGVWQVHSTGPSTRAVLTGFAAASEQQVRVKAENASGESTWSNVLTVTLATGSVDPLVWEAEQAVLYGDFVSATDAAASGAAYITSPDNGIFYDDTVSAHRAEFTMDISEPGKYKFFATVAAANSGSGSFFIQVNDGERYIWNAMQEKSFTEVAINAYGHSDELLVDLDAGTHVVNVYIREDGVALDKLRLLRVGDMSSGGVLPGDPVNPVPTIKDNLISNASFESGVAPWTARYSSTVMEDSSARFTGEKSLLSLDRTYAYSGPAITVTHLIQARGKYTVTGAVKLKGENSEPLRVTLAISDNSGFRFDMIGTDVLVGEQWVEFSGEIDLSASSVIDSAYILFYGPAAQREFYLDQVSLIPVEPSTPIDPVAENLLRNGDFETDGTSDWLRAYGGTVDTSMSARSGKYSLMSSARSNWYDGFYQNIGGKIQAGKTYSLSAWARLQSGSDNMDTRILYQDDAGYHWLSLTKVATGTGWTPLNAEFSINPSGTLKTVDLFFFGPAAHLDFMVDDISLTEAK